MQMGGSPPERRRHPLLLTRPARNGIVSRPYTIDEIDAIAGYCAELDRCYFLPFARFIRRSTIQLRLAPTRNNQARGVIWAHEFEFESLDWENRSFLGP